MIELNATLIAQIINFLLLVAILTKLAYKPLMKALEERKNRIEASIDQADRAQKEAEELKRQYQEQLAKARAEAQNIVEKATRLAEQTKDEILTAARAEHAKLLKEAQDEISRERERALSELRGEVVALSMAAATKIIEKNLDAETNSKLVTDFINKLDDKKIGGLPC
ncbi:MAG: F0F1 ATP synthase subunit B [Veillonellaceae bacterium]|nr:F0F1 ATP synthase subunit B [Veillonellaceae bacterium]